MRREFTRIYRVERIDSDRALLEISEEYDTLPAASDGPPDAAHPYRLGEPQLTETYRAQLAQLTWDVAFLELRPSPTALHADTCSVRRAAGSAHD